MDLTELKEFMKIDSNDFDAVLPSYQMAAEEYLLGAGVAKDYSKAMYKIIITVICANFIENPSLVGAKGGIGGLEITVNALIAQLRLS